MDELFDKWITMYKENGLDTDLFWKDGIINKEKYKKASRKILFVLKEPYAYEGGDLRELLINGPIDRKWNTVARWAAGLLEGFPSYDKIDNKPKMKESLPKIAVINLKKTSKKSGNSKAIEEIVNA